VTARVEKPAERFAAPVTEATPPPVPTLRSAAARRRTSRRSLVLGVLVVLLGGLIAFAAGRMLTAHTEVLAVARDVRLGSTITADDLTVANVTSDPNLAPIPASQQSEIVGMVAEVPLMRGELLTRAQVGTGSGLTEGELQVALPLKEGQFPVRGLTPGQQVLIVPTPDNGGSVSGNGAATVADVGSINSATQVTVVDVRVREADGPTVAQLAATGSLALVLLPAGR
jgi:hypothetical protein